MSTAIQRRDTTPHGSAPDTTQSSRHSADDRQGPRLPAATRVLTPPSDGASQHNDHLFLPQLAGVPETSSLQHCRIGARTARAIDTAPLDTTTVDTVPDRSSGTVPVDPTDRAGKKVTAYSEALLIACVFALRCNPLDQVDATKAHVLLKSTLSLGHAKVLRWRQEVDPNQWTLRWRKAVALTREFYPNHTGASRLPDELEHATESGLLPAY